MPMQLFALDHLSQVIHAKRAKKKINYLCLECKQDVRLRGGIHRQPHFFHLEPKILCRQHQKGAVHLKLQEFFLAQLPLGDCRLEYPFPEIGRIADVAWLSKKIVFEIQVSPLSGEEAIARNRDYEMAGWSVVWILHDSRYNQFHLTSIEMALSPFPHFFTNMDRFGKGIIYDQFDLKNGGIRVARLNPLPVEIKNISDKIEAREFPLVFLQKRAAGWNCFFSGDLMALFLHDLSSPYLKQAAKLEKKWDVNQKRGKILNLFRLFLRKIANLYRILFRFLLEKACQ